MHLFCTDPKLARASSHCHLHSRLLCCIFPNIRLHGVVFSTAKNLDNDKVRYDILLYTICLRKGSTKLLAVT